jgi:hypothetical protein
VRVRQTAAPAGLSGWCRLPFKKYPRPYGQERKPLACDFNPQLKVKNLNKPLKIND